MTGTSGACVTWKRLGLLGVVVAILLGHSSDAPACGPFPHETLFSYRAYPVLDLEAYAAGELGVVQPTYWRRFLFVAYRYLSRVPLSAAEQAAFLGPQGRAAARGGDARWREARVRVPGVAPLPSRIVTARRVPGSDWQRFENCTDDGFATAAETIDRRIAQFGAASDAVRRWLEAQDLVFSNCAGGAAIPAEPEADLPPELAADRRYQIAAAHFYALQLTEAERAFAVIAGDRSSPWSDISAYLVARSLLRRATLDAQFGFLDRELAARAVSTLQAIIDDPGRRSVHAAAEALQGYALVRVSPGARLAGVADALTVQDADDFRQLLIDFQFLMDRDFPGKADARADSDMVDWVMAFQAGEFDHALERWRATGSQPWLVAAMVHLPADHPSAADLRAAAAAVPGDSPAWATLTYHRVRQLIESGQAGAARTELDAVLALPPLASLGRAPVRNLLLSQRFALSPSLDDALRFAPRRPVAEGTGLGEGFATRLPADTPDLLFAPDAVRVFNQGLPLELLAHAAASDVLLPHLRAQLTLATWVRAVLLERWDTARGLSPALRAHFATLGPDLDGFLAAANDEERRFAAAYLLLRHPRMKPHLLSGLAMKTNLEGLDRLRDNWWCSFSSAADLDREGFWRFRAFGGEQPAVEPAPFLDAGQRAALGREWAALQRLETAPNYLAAIVTAYAASRPGDARGPEVLHLAVRATRFGCTDAGTGDRSRDAFRLLHRRWPDSPWTERTPYWFR